MVKSRLRALATGALGEERFARWRKPAWFGISRQTRPVSGVNAVDRGTPIGRWYDRRFLDQHSNDIRGHVLEIRDPLYSSRYPNVTKIDVLDIDASLPDVTVVADLTDMPHVSSNTYDCAIVTRTFQYLRDIPAAIRELHRVLAPGGVLLAAHSGVAGRLTSLEGFEREFGYLAPYGTATLFGEVFGEDKVTVQTWGNVLACMAFLRGVSAEEVGETRLLAHDPFFPQTITVRAVKTT